MAYIYTCWKCGNEETKEFIDEKTQNVGNNVICSKCFTKSSDCKSINLNDLL